MTNNNHNGTQLAGAAAVACSDLLDLVVIWHPHLCLFCDALSMDQKAKVANVQTLELRNHLGLPAQL